MFVVVSYDIPNDRRRGKVSQTLLGFGLRVQYSVFECDLSEKEYTGLRKRLAGLLDVKEDSVRYYKLCQTCRQRVAIEGPGALHREPSVYIV